MSKPFITYTAQIEKLKNEKNLIISDTDFALESLQNISYYALIDGCKHPFIDIHTRKYRNGACFEDIVALYEFDEELRGIFFKYLCRVERKMRSSISYHFCKKYGERQEEYLDFNNYSNLPKNKNGIIKLIKMLEMMAKQNNDHEYLVYQRNKYHNIPLWVILNTLTFGQISKMFEFLPQNMQGTICQDFGNVKKNDLFSVVIVFCYLLPKADFLLFQKQLLHMFDRYEKQDSNLKLDVLLEYMGFPANWEEITKLYTKHTKHFSQ